MPSIEVEAVRLSRGAMSVIPVGSCKNVVYPACRKQSDEDLHQLQLPQIHCCGGQSSKSHLIHLSHVRKQVFCSVRDAVLRQAIRATRERLFGTLTAI